MWINEGLAFWSEPIKILFSIFENIIFFKHSWSVRSTLPAI